MENKVKFKELSFPMKLGIVGGWTTIIIYLGAFIVGVLEGIIYG